MATNKSQNSEIAVLQTQMDEVIKKLDHIQQTIEEQVSSYVTIEEFKAFKAMSWLTHTASALVVAAITALIAFFVSHINR